MYLYACMGEFIRRLRGGYGRFSLGLTASTGGLLWGPGRSLLRLAVCTRGLSCARRVNSDFLTGSNDSVSFESWRAISCYGR